MNKETPLVSIITVVFNGVHSIRRTIESVLNQSYTSIQYVIIDGGSTDGTVEIIRQYGSRIGYWVSEPDKGISDAFNKGIKACKGRYIGIINSDDWYELDAVELAVSVLEREGVGFVTGNLRKHSGNSSYISYPQDLNRSIFLYKALIFNHPSCFVRKDVYEALGGFNCQLKYAMDYDFILRCLLNNVEYSLVNQVLSNMQDGGVSESSIKQTLREVREISLMHGANPVLLSLIFTIKRLILEVRLFFGLPKLGTYMRNFFLGKR